MVKFDWHYSRLLAGVTVVCLGTAVVAAQTVGSGPTPVPKATLLPATKYAVEVNNSPLDSFPFLAADRNLRPYNLKKLGYVEQEFLVSGAANVYDWATDGTLSVKTPNAPYTTRILVRYPADPARFSGNVVVEPLNDARRFDWAMMWGYLSGEIVERGDAWVGVTMPGALFGLKRFDPKRYAALSYANPTPGACPGGNNAAAANDVETGLMWDALSQTGALLKSKTPGGPLAGYNIQYLYMTGQSAPQDYIQTYVNAIHPHARLADGKFIYDGYLIKHSGGVHGLNACAAVPPKGDPRHVTKNAGVPVIAIVAQGEVLLSLAARRQDSDEPNDRYRLYEVPGGYHLDKYPYVALPSMQDAAAGGNAQGTPDWPFNQRCDPEILIADHPLMVYLFKSALANLDLWARKGTPPPRADRIALKDADTAKASLVTDQYGAGVGGVRSFYVDIPAASYSPGSPGPGLCATQGHTVPFDWGTLEGTYGSYKNYVSKVTSAVDRAVQERWFTESDGRKIKTGFAVAPPVLHATGDGH